jgi:hypothetical protein
VIDPSAQYVKPHFYYLRTSAAKVVLKGFGKTQPCVLRVRKIAAIVLIQTNAIDVKRGLFYLMECALRKTSALRIRVTTLRLAYARFASHRVKVAITTARANSVPNSYIS